MQTFLIYKYFFAKKKKDEIIVLFLFYIFKFDGKCAFFAPYEDCPKSVQFSLITPEGVCRYVEAGATENVPFSAVLLVFG